MNKVTVSRPDKMTNAGVSLYVYCDGKQVGKIKNKESCSFELEDGNHKLEIGHRNADDSHITVDSKSFTIAGNDVCIDIGVSFMGFKIDKVQ